MTLQNRLIPKYYFCSCESNHHFAAIINFDCISLCSLSQVLSTFCGKIFCEHYQPLIREYDDHNFVCRKSERA